MKKEGLGEFHMVKSGGTGEISSNLPNGLL